MSGISSVIANCDVIYLFKINAIGRRYILLNNQIIIINGLQDETDLMEL